MAAIEKALRTKVLLAVAVGAVALAFLLAVSPRGPPSVASPRGPPLGGHPPTVSPGSDVAVLYTALPTDTARRLYFEQSDGLKKPVDPRLVALDQLFIGCVAPNTVLSRPDDATNMGGQCCGTLANVHHYEEQLDALRAEFGMNPEAPPDPYNVSVPVAKKWIRYNREVRLSPAQQRVFDDAMEMSKEKPCCCRCWKYYVYEGLGKYLIVNGMSAQQVARLWDLSDACGGPSEHSEAVHA